MKRRIALCVMTIFLMYRAGTAFCEELVIRTEDVIYGRKSGMALTLDVFQPVKSNGSGLLFLVNGGWLSS